MEMGICEEDWLTFIESKLYDRGKKGKSIRFIFKILLEFEIHEN